MEGYWLLGAILFYSFMCACVFWAVCGLVDPFLFLFFFWNKLSLKSLVCSSKVEVVVIYSYIHVD